MAQERPTLNMSEKRIVTSFEELNVSRRLHTVLATNHIVTPTPIQAEAIPIALDGRDLIGIAQTGTGKTLAFALPMIERQKPGDVGLVLAPTRELALQIEKTFIKLGASTVLLIGGAPIEKQVYRLRRSPQFIIATPGRLIDHLSQRTCDLRRVTCITLDEADRMFDMGFAPSIRRILSQAPEQRQTLMFSATMPDEIVDLVNTYLVNPERVEVARAGTAAENVDQQLVVVPFEEKGRVLHELILDHPGPALVFTRTRHGARKVALALRNFGHAAAEIHSDRSLSQRFDAMEGFRQGRYRVLVATDIAARGIDVKDISVVVNYDLPNDPEDYVHRIGRTGRAGASGVAYTLATPDQRGLLRGVEELIQMEIPSSERSMLTIERNRKARRRVLNQDQREMVAAVIGDSAASEGGVAVAERVETVETVETAESFEPMAERRPLPPAEVDSEGNSFRRPPYRSSWQNQSGGGGGRDSRGRNGSDRDRPRPSHQGGNDRPWQNRADRPAGDRPSFQGNRDRPWQGRDAGAGANEPRPERPEGDRPGFGGNRERPWQKRESGPASNDRRPEGGRPWQDKPWENRGDRPGYQGRNERPAGDRPGFQGNRDRPWQNRGDRPGYQGNNDRPQGGRPWENRGDRPGYQGNNDRPQGGRPWENREERPRYQGNNDRPQGGRPWENREERPRYQGNNDRPQGGRPWENREERPRYQGNNDRPQGGRPWENREERPRYQGNNDRPQGGRPWENRGDRPGYQGNNDRPQGGRPWENREERPRYQGNNDRPQGDRPWQNRGERPGYQGNSDRPRFQGNNDRPHKSFGKPGFKKDYSKPSFDREAGPSNFERKHLGADNGRPAPERPAGKVTRFTPKAFKKGPKSKGKGSPKPFNKGRK